MTVAKRKRNLRKLWEDILTGKKSAPKNESVWFQNPLIAFLYTKYHRKKRWDEKSERGFYADIRATYHYIKWLVCDLGLECPDHLHNFMLAKSLENDSDGKEWVDLYFKINENKRKV